MPLALSVFRLCCATLNTNGFGLESRRAGLELSFDSVTGTATLGANGLGPSPLVPGP